MSGRSSPVYALVGTNTVSMGGNVLTFVAILWFVLLKPGETSAFCGSLIAEGYLREVVGEAPSGPSGEPGGGSSADGEKAVYGDAVLL